MHRFTNLRKTVPEYFLRYTLLRPLCLRKLSDYRELTHPRCLRRWRTAFQDSTRQAFRLGNKTDQIIEESKVTSKIPCK